METETVEKGKKEMTESEIKERMFYLKKQILTMEWDAQRNQLNQGRASYLEKIKQEYAKLELVLNPEKTVITN